MTMYNFDQYGTDIINPFVQYILWYAVHQVTFICRLDSCTITIYFEMHISSNMVNGVDRLLPMGVYICNGSLIK
jgi:hypothetical protein